MQSFSCNAPSILTLMQQRRSCKHHILQTAVCSASCSIGPISCRIPRFGMWWHLNIKPLPGLICCGQHWPLPCQVRRRVPVKQVPRHTSPLRHFCERQPVCALPSAGCRYSCMQVLQAIQAVSVQEPNASKSDWAAYFHFSLQNSGYALPC